MLPPRLGLQGRQGRTRVADRGVHRRGPRLDVLRGLRLGLHLDRVYPVLGPPGLCSRDRVVRRALSVFPGLWFRGHPLWGGMRLADCFAVWLLG